MYCLGVTLIKKDVGIVDCVNYNPATMHHWYNHYYAISASVDHEVES